MGTEIDEMYRKYGPMVYRRCRYLLGSDDDALDALQDVFLQLARRPGLAVRFPSSLLFRIATNVCISLLRQRQRAPVHLCDTLAETLASGEDHVSLVLARDMLDTIFRDEKESTRTIAVLYYIDRMTYEQVAAEVDLSVSGVRRRLSRLQDRIAALRKKEETA